MTTQSSSSSSSVSVSVPSYATDLTKANIALRTAVVNGKGIVAAKKKVKDLHIEWEKQQDQYEQPAVRYKNQADEYAGNVEHFVSAIPKGYDNLTKADLKAAYDYGDLVQDAFYQGTKTEQDEAMKGHRKAYDAVFLANGHDSGGPAQYEAGAEGYARVLALRGVRGDLPGQVKKLDKQDYTELKQRFDAENERDSKASDRESGRKENKASKTFDDTLALFRKPRDQSGFAGDKDAMEFADQVERRIEKAKKQHEEADKLKKEYGISDNGLNDTDYSLVSVLSAGNEALYMHAQGQRDKAKVELDRIDEAPIKILAEKLRDIKKDVGKIKSARTRKTKDEADTAAVKRENDRIEELQAGGVNLTDAIGQAARERYSEDSEDNQEGKNMPPKREDKSVNSAEKKFLSSWDAYYDRPGVSVPLSSEATSARQKIQGLAERADREPDVHKKEELWFQAYQEMEGVYDKLRKGDASDKQEAIRWSSLMSTVGGEILRPLGSTTNPLVGGKEKTSEPPSWAKLRAGDRDLSETLDRVGPPPDFGRQGPNTKPPLKRDVDSLTASLKRDKLLPDVLGIQPEDVPNLSRTAAKEANDYTGRIYTELKNQEYIRSDRLKAERETKDDGELAPTETKSSSKTGSKDYKVEKSGHIRIEGESTPIGNVKKLSPRGAAETSTPWWVSQTYIGNKYQPPYAFGRTKAEAIENAVAHVNEYGRNSDGTVKDAQEAFDKAANKEQPKGPRFPKQPMTVDLDGDGKVEKDEKEVVSAKSAVSTAHTKRLDLDISPDNPKLRDSHGHWLSKSEDLAEAVAEYKDNRDGGKSGSSAKSERKAVGAGAGAGASDKRPSSGRKGGRGKVRY